MTKAAILLAVAALQNAPAAAQTTPHKEAVVPQGMDWAPNIFHFSPAVRSGDLLFLSGVGASLRPGETEADKEKAIDRAFQEIARVLAEAGASWDDVLEMTSYHTDFTPNAATRDQQALFRKVKDRYVRAPHLAWTAVGVTRLWTEPGFVEMRVIARVPAKPRSTPGQ